MIIGENYEIIQSLGKGSFGEVFLARQKDREGLFAVKYMKLNLESSSHFRKYRQDVERGLRRFRDQAEKLLGFEHPNVAPLSDVGKTAEGDFYLAFEFVEGTTLAQLIEEKGGLHPERALRILTQVLKALEAAHEKSFLHCDLRPQMIMIQKDNFKDKVLLLETGVARIFQEFDQQVHFTQNKELLGIPMYMAPEQASAGEINETTDLYSLGLVFYEMLTGQAPFPKEDNNRVLHYQLTKYPKFFAEVAPDKDIPEALEEFTFHAIQKDQKNRFQSAREMREVAFKLRKIKSDRLPSQSLARQKRMQTGRQNWEEATFRERIPRWTWMAMTGGLAILFMIAYFQLSSPGDKVSYKEYIAKGEHAFRASQFEKARDFLLKARSLKGTKEVDRLLGKVQKRKDYRELLRQSRKALEGKNYHKARKLAKSALEMEFFSSDYQEERVEEARKIYDKAHRVLQFNSLKSQAKRAFENRRYDKARDLAEKAMKIKMEKALSQLSRRAQGFLLYHRAKEQERLGNTRGAIGSLKKALQLSSSEEFSAQLEWLKVKIQSSAEKKPSVSYFQGAVELGGTKGLIQWSKMIEKSSQGQMFRHSLNLQGDYPRRQEVSPHQGQIKWKINSQSSLSQPVSTEEEIIFVSQDSSGAVINSIQKNSQKSVWKTSLEGTINATPAIWKDYLCVANEDSLLYCLSTKTGEIRWKQQLSSTLPTRNSAAIIGKTVYQLLGQGELTALDLDTGKIQWRAEIPGKTPATTPAFFANHIFVVFVTSQRGGLWIGNLQGKEVLTLPLTDSQFWKKSSAPHKPPLIYSSPLVSQQGIVYIANSRGRVYALDVENKKILWVSRNWHWDERKEGIKDRRGPWMSSLALSRDTLIAGGPDGFIYALDSQTGQEKWRYELKDLSYSSPSVCGNEVYIGDEKGILYAFDIRQGKKLWQLELKKPLPSPVAIDEGILYLVEQKGDLVAINGRKGSN